jgi:hypothetical protein
MRFTHYTHTVEEIAAEIVDVVRAPRTVGVIRGKRSKAALKKAVGQIVLAQGNTFIKELLRSNNVTIGSTKADFAKNLNNAIDAGTLSQVMIEAWLGEIEGWGNQHIYLFEPPAIAHADISPALKASTHAGLLGRAVSYEFPDRLTLTSINLSADHLSITWHRSRGGWERAKAKDFQRDEGLDRVEYRAYRERFARSVVRFEWRLDDPYCAVLIELRNEGDDHEQTLKQIWNDLTEVGLVPDPLVMIRLSSAIKTLSRKTEATVQSTRLTTEGGHVELVSTLTRGGIEAVEAVREVRRGVEDANFSAADGMFNFMAEQHKRLSRMIKVQGYGTESRLRIWVQCKREDVYVVLAIIWANNAA